PACSHEFSIAGSRMRATVAFFLGLTLLSSPALFAASEGETPIQRSIVEAANRAAASLAKGGTGGNDGNPYVTPSLVMISAGAVVAILGSTLPQLRTQTDDYDLCAAAHGGPTGPSTRVPACDDYRTINKGLVAVGLASVIA